MPYALGFDGVNDYVSLTDVSDLTGDNWSFYLEAKPSTFPTTGNKAICSGDGLDLHEMIRFTHSGQTIGVRQQNTFTEYGPGTDFSDFVRIFIDCVAGTARVYINDNDVGAWSGTTFYRMIWLGGAIRGVGETNYFAATQVKKLKMVQSGVVVQDFDATASSHLAGTPTLKNLALGGADALGTNMPTDGSAWVINELPSVYADLDLRNQVLSSVYFRYRYKKSNISSIAFCGFRCRY